MATNEAALRIRDSKSPFGSFIPLFLAEKVARGELKPSSTRDYGARLREFDKFTGYTDLESALTMEHARAWQRAKREDGLSAEISATMYLKSFATWACLSEYRCGPEGHSVLVHLKAPPAKKKDRYAYTPQQLDVIWTAVSNSDIRPNPQIATALLRLLLATGMRKQEARDLLRKDFHVNEVGRGGLITVREKRYTEVGARKLRLDPDTTAAVNAYIGVRPEYAAKRARGLEPLWLSRKGLGYTVQSFNNVVKRISKFIGEETGIPWTAEDMRFTSDEERSALLHDPDLREKCAATLESSEGDANLEDAVMAASKILEVRVREACNPPAERRSGVALMEFAFNELKPALRLSNDAREQTGVARMYAGLMGFYRNRAVHEVRRDLDQRAARQIVLWIDHLLALLDEAVLQTYS